MLSPSDTILGSAATDNEAVLVAFINAASEVPDHIAVVLNDYHMIEEPTIHEAVTLLLDHLPPKFHFILASREEAPLPLSR